MPGKKNINGGKGHKKQASKNFKTQSSNKIRLAELDGEYYAQVLKLLGNGMCHVQDLKGKKYLCIIRGSFRGRNKNGNRLENGTWILIGTRDWASKPEKSDKLETCDLLEVYSQNDKEFLKNAVDENWSLFVSSDFANSNVEETDEGFQFSNKDQQDYQVLLKQIESESKNENKTNIISFSNKNGASSSDDDNDDINIDDI